MDGRNRSGHDEDRESSSGTVGIRWPYEIFVFRIHSIWNRKETSIDVIVSRYTMRETTTSREIGDNGHSQLADLHAEGRVSRDLRVRRVQ